MGHAHMRIIFAFAIALSCFASAAQAMKIDASALARYDISYVKCEAQFPEMRGLGDEAYLSLWRVNPDDKVRAQLAAARKSAAYQVERRRVQQAEAKRAAPAAAGPLEQQCRALWGEAKRTVRARK